MHLHFNQCFICWRDNGLLVITNMLSSYTLHTVFPFLILLSVVGKVLGSCWIKSSHFNSSKQCWLNQHMYFKKRLAIFCFVTLANPNFKRKILNNPSMLLKVIEYNEGIVHTEMTIFRKCTPPL